MELSRVILSDLSVETEIVSKNVQLEPYQQVDQIKVSLGELKTKPENDEPEYPEPDNENTHLLMEKAKVNEQEIQKLKIQASQVKKKWPKGDYCIWAGKDNWCPTAFHHLRREMTWVLKYADFNISHGYYQEIGSTHIGFTGYYNYFVLSGCCTSEPKNIFYITARD
ncbi:uncharacterized protein LOC134856137 [Symsagittifera roscoffensis]|uniref:uncharacterized protein LOC134856137 n=1 Tax=Symsagittifera roscoffensis TaxID=84072 RepID=UPI00307BB178